MNTKLKKYAPYALYLSLLAAVVTIGLGVVQQSFTLPVQISLAVTVIGLLLAGIFNPEKVRSFLTGRQARYASNAILIVFATLGILVIANYIAHRYDQRWDMTQDQSFSLTKETVNVLESLTTSVKAEAYFTTDGQINSSTAKEMLDTYKFYGKGKFDYEFVDPNKNPIRAQEAKITRNGTIVFKMGDRQEQVTFPGEEDFTSAILKLNNPGKRSVYFLTGHGEASISDQGDSSITQLRSSLEAKNYTVSALNLLSDRKIPEEALAVIIAGPQKPLTEDEVKLLDAYLKTGGGLIYLSDPAFMTESPNASNPLDVYLKTTWGIELENNLVIDQNVNPPFATYLQEFGKHAITAKLGYAVLMPYAHSVIPDETKPEGINSTILAVSSSNTWAETDIANIEKSLAFDAQTDKQGPVPVAVAANNTNTNAKIVVFGNTAFSRDKYFTQAGNSDFIMNSIDWSAKQDSLISLTPKNKTTRALISPQVYTIGLILLAVLIVIPGLVITMGIVSWIQRKSRG